MDLPLHMIRAAADPGLRDVADRVLIEKTLAGQQECFSVLMDRHLGSVQRRVSRMIANAADIEDVIQEVQLKTWTHLSSFRSDSSFRTWIVRIAINECLQFHRKAKRSRWDAANLDYLIAPTESPLQTYVRKETKRAVRKTIHELPARFQEILTLRDLNELTTKEAARYLDWSPQTVKTRLFRARTTLAKVLQAREKILLPVQTPKAA